MVGQEDGDTPEGQQGFAADDQEARGADPSHQRAKQEPEQPNVP